MAVKKATVDSTMAKVEAAKKETAKTETKAAPAKKAAAPKATAPVAKVFIEFNNGQVSADEITAKAVEISGKKSVKDLNVYYQPETGMVYFTADGEEGSFAL